MGHRSATRHAAAVAIQCWARRQLDITHCMQLLGLLHIIRHEEQNEEDALLLRELAAREGGNAHVDHHDENHTTDIAASAALLTDLATLYSERLQQENFTRRLLLESYADELRGASDAAQKAVRQHRGIRRLSLLPRELLREVLEELRDTPDTRHASCPESKVLTRHLFMCNAFAKAAAARGGVVACGVARAMAAGKEPNAPARALCSDLTHSERSRKTHKLQRTKQSNDAQSHAESASDGGEDPMLSDVKPLPKPPSLPRHSDCSGLNNESNAAEALDKSSDAAASTDSSCSDAYNDDVYYERQRAREQTRMARISSAMQMADCTTSTDGALCDDFMQDFGDVDSVAFLALATAHMKPTATAAADGDVPCCAVCELRGDEEDAGLIVCGCGRHVHTECAEKFGNSELRCSRFCQAAL